MKKGAINLWQIPENIFLYLFTFFLLWVRFPTKAWNELAPFLGVSSNIVFIKLNLKKALGFNIISGL